MEKCTRGKFAKIIKNINLRTCVMIGALFLIWIIFTVGTMGAFITTRNISNLFRQTAIIGIMGISMVLIIVTCGIDLSCGALCGLISIIAAVMMAWGNIATIPTILVLLLIGLMLGALTGTLIAYAGIPAFITTLGLQMGYKGAMLAIGRGVSISPMNPGFRIIADNYISPILGQVLACITIVSIAILTVKANNSKKKFGLEVETAFEIWGKILFFSAIVLVFIFVMNTYRGIPLPVMVMFALVLIFTFISQKTPFGRNIYSIGGNPAAAKFAGINVKRNLLMVYTLNGLMAAIAGIILGARLNAGMPNAGQNYELDAIAAAVIGGASMSGGVGHVAGAILGALFMSTIDNGMSMMNVDQSWQYMLKGAILLVAVWFDMRTRNKKIKYREA